ncbi:MAG: class I tRNA ligase family protein, partial [Actinobacteria bacterium]|nr:class I tRNA ligase family protein [Actinomycetota bacterium]
MARFYLTTPIYYVNDVPHLGHAYTTVNADAIARWHRLCGEEVRLVTGTDEHGRKISEAASMHGVEPQEWVDRTSQRFREAWDLLEVAADRFVRTTEPRHELAVQRFLGAIYDNGFIELGTFEGLYCVACEAYYGHDELDDGNCPVHGRPVELMKEENYFFKLSAFQDRLLQWYESHPNAVAPESRRNEALGFIRGGLQDISITRTSIDWGIRVPWDPAHVFYVWFDALVGYLTGIDFDSGDDEFAPWWAASHHLLGKDIVRFHAVWWPAMCMAAGIDPPQRLFVHGWL